MNDVTQRRRLDYQDAEHFYVVVQHAPSGAGTPHDGRVLAINPTFLVLLLPSCREWVGLLAAVPEGVLNAFCRSLELGALYTLPTRRRRTLLSNLSHAFPEKTETWRRQMGLEATLPQLWRWWCFCSPRPISASSAPAAAVFYPRGIEEIILDGFAAAAPGADGGAISPHFSMMEANTLRAAALRQAASADGCGVPALDLPAFEKWVKETRERWGVRLLIA